jgi:[ribosomal protein S5]-alanine N-acetyltransferase
VTANRRASPACTGGSIATLIWPHMRTLSTSLCTLEPQVVAHAPEMFVVLGDPAIYEFEGEPPPSLELLVNGFRRRENRTSPDGTERWLNWVVRKTGGELTGYVQASVLTSGCSYVGYEFSSKFWRQGLASSAITAVLEELRSNYGVHTFVAVLKTANYRSMGLLQKLGFTPCPGERVSEFESLGDESILLKLVGPQNRTTCESLECAMNPIEPTTTRILSPKNRPEFRQGCGHVP